MKVGLIARSENRGLGIMCWEFFRHMQPDRTLLIDLGDLARGFERHNDRFPGATHVSWSDGTLPEVVTREWLEGLDVVYSAETFYDWRLCDWARVAGVKTVLHVMPEFYKHASEPTLPAPDVLWAPTTWRLEYLPAGTVVVPVPVALDKLQQAQQPRTSSAPLRVLHVVGRRAAHDRNGTNAVARSVSFARKPWHLRLASQDSRVPFVRSTRHVRIEVQRSVDDYWQLYNDVDVLVLPRRYGGLSLPAQEGLASGLAVVMPDCSPNRDWPIVPTPCSLGGTMNTQGGLIKLVTANAQHLADAIDRLCDGDDLSHAQDAARAWAAAHSWDALLPAYRAQLEVAAEK